MYASHNSPARRTQRARLGGSVVKPLVLALAGFGLLFGVLGASNGARAQVHINQVEETTSQVEGASQAQIFVAEAEDEVSREEVETLTGSVPVLPTGTGNSAALLQEGSGNEAIIRQVGIQNQASGTQRGANNELAITQGGSLFLPEGEEPALPSPDVVFERVREFFPPSGGENNLAVGVQNGTGNRTSITQLGRNNAAGIRLVGSNNTMNLLQNGNANRFLMDTQVTGEEMTVVQDGRSNSLQTNLPINARMKGNNIEMIVRRDAFAPLR